jgi:hypothetical protein
MRRVPRLDPASMGISENAEILRIGFGPPVYPSR